MDGIWLHCSQSGNSLETTNQTMHSFWSVIVGMFQLRLKIHHYIQIKLLFIRVEISTHYSIQLGQSVGW